MSADDSWFERLENAVSEIFGIILIGAFVVAWGIGLWILLWILLKFVKFTWSLA